MGMTDVPDASSRRRPGRRVTSSGGVVPITTTVPRSLVDWLRGYADENEVPMAQIVTRALIEYRIRVEAPLAGAVGPADVEEGGSE